VQISSNALWHCCTKRDVPDLALLGYYLWGHMKTLVYEVKVDLRAALCRCIFTAADHMCNHHDNMASANQSMLMHAEKCMSPERGNFETVTCFYFFK
jgi:hypothetical protein